MELGTGIAIGTLSISVGAVAITAIRSRSVSTDKPMPCLYHESLVTSISFIKESVKTIQEDIKQILKGE
jgi:hypothetical protein